jgi:energy-coupling factor transporter ATP-binding protein EcfA2
MALDLRDSVVSILKPDRTVAGTGFVVSSDGLVATCAHVVRYAGAEPGGTVDLTFHATRETRVARTEPEYWRDPSAEDVAILRLEGSLPDKTQAVLLGGAAEAYDHHFSTFGSPPRYEGGMWGYGTIGNLTYHPAAGPMLQLSSTSEVTAGFSGAPVLDTDTYRVVGMVSAITNPDQYGRLAQTALATPTKTLLRVCPALQPSEVCPYRSLNTFTETDAEFFFGRERVVKSLLKRLQQEPSFVALLGPSGSGKSSLIQAGLIPQLRSMGNVPGSDSWEVITIREYDDPFEQLSAAGLVGASDGLDDAVGAWLEQHRQYGRLVLFLDQFEELLVTCSGPVCQDFVEQLTKLLDSPWKVTIILTMQDVHYSRFARQAPDLVQGWLPGGLAQLRDLDQSELTAIVQEPAQKVGLRFEEGLIEDIVDDAMEAASVEGGDTTRSTVLPLLEFALTQLWARRQEGTLTRKAYNDIGRLTGMLTMWADQAFRALGLHDKSLQYYARRIFTDLVRPGDEGKDIPSSRRRSLADLYRDDTESEAIQRVIKRLTEARLLVTAHDTPPGGREFVEIIDDTLPRKWGRLHNWLKEERVKFEKWHPDIEKRAQSWLESSPKYPARRDEDKLLKGRDLEEAESWLLKYGANLSELEREFLYASIYGQRYRGDSHPPVVKPDFLPSGPSRKPDFLPSGPSRKPDFLPGRST